MPIPSRSLYELSLALRRTGVDISKLSHTDMLRLYVAPYLKAAGEGNEGAAIIKANMELVKGMTPRRRIGLAEDISKIDYSGINPSLEYSLGNHNYDRDAHSKNFRFDNWQDPDFGIVHYGASLPNHGLEKIAGLIMPYRYIDLSNPEYNKRLSDNYKKLMGMDIGYSGIEGLGNLLDVNVHDLNDYLYNEFAYDTERRKFLNHEKETVKAVLDYARENGLKNIDGTPWVPSAEDIMRTTFTFGNGITGPGIKKREISPSSYELLEWIPKFGKDVEVDPVMNHYKFFQFRDYNGDIWTSSNPTYAQRYADHPYSVWKTYHSGENMLTAPKLPMINLGYTYENLPFVFNKEKGILEFHPDFKLNLTEQYKDPDPNLVEEFPRPGGPLQGTYIQEFKNGDPERISKVFGGSTEMTADDLLLISKENGFSGIVIPDFYGNQTWRVYNPNVELIKAPSWEPAWMTAYKMTKHKKGGKLIPKGQEGLGKWFLRQLRRFVPTVALTTKEVEKVAPKSEAAANLQKGVLRALKISKSALFKELVNGLGLEDRVSSELISRYNALDSNKQKAERDIIYNLMKNGQIHSITDFDLAVDKIGRGKEAKDPNLYKYKTLADFDSEHTLGYFLKLGKEKVAKEKYDKAFGSFEKRQDFPKLGLSLYSVPETLLGQTDLAYVMRKLDAKTPAPWCVLETDKEGNPTTRAIYLWNEMYGGPKYVLADRNGKIHYFKSGHERFFNKQDKSMIFFPKTDPKTGIKTSYTLEKEQFPFSFAMDSKSRKMSNGNEIELHYLPNGDLLNGSITRQRSHTYITPKGNGLTEVSTYEDGPSNVKSRGQWRTTPSGMRLFEVSDNGRTKTYNNAGELLMENQDGFSTIYSPEHVFTSGGRSMGLWDRDDYFKAIGSGYASVSSDHFNAQIMAEPLFLQDADMFTGEFNISPYSKTNFKNIGDAIQGLGFKFPIYKRGGVLK